MAQLHPVAWWHGNRRIDVVYSGNAQNVTLFTAPGVNSPTDPVDVYCTINANVFVGSALPGSYAFDTGIGWHSKSRLFLIINGEIQGCAGNGGVGGNANTLYTFSYNDDGKSGIRYDLASGSVSGGGGANGTAGGPAFHAQFPISVTNNGAIRGGGGGGGGGGGAAGDKNAGQPHDAGGGGGGGGRGYTAGSGAAGGQATYQFHYQAGTAGAGPLDGTTTTFTSGTYLGNGSGGGNGSQTSNGGAGSGYVGAQGAGNCQNWGGNGGAGGLGGSSGANGASAGNNANSTSENDGGGGSGLAGGAAVVGNANITWIAVGTREGSIT